MAATPTTFRAASEHAIEVANLGVRYSLVLVLIAMFVFMGAQAEYVIARLRMAQQTRNAE